MPLTYKRVSDTVEAWPAPISVPIMALVNVVSWCCVIARFLAWLAPEDNKHKKRDAATLGCLMAFFVFVNALVRLPIYLVQLAAFLVKQGIVASLSVVQLSAKSLCRAVTYAAWTGPLNLSRWIAERRKAHKRAKDHEFYRAMIRAYENPVRTKRHAYAYYYGPSVFLAVLTLLVESCHCEDLMIRGTPVRAIEIFELCALTTASLIPLIVFWSCQDDAIPWVVWYLEGYAMQCRARLQAEGGHCPPYQIKRSDSGYGIDVGYLSDKGSETASETEE